MKPRAYKVQKLKISVKKGDPWGDSQGPKGTFEQQLLLFSVIPTKKQQVYYTKISPKKSKVPLGRLTFNQKKAKLKLVTKGKKGTKESKLSLGSWLAFYGANMMCIDC